MLALNCFLLFFKPLAKTGCVRGETYRGSQGIISCSRLVATLHILPPTSCKLRWTKNESHFYETYLEKFKWNHELFTRVENIPNWSEEQGKTQFLWKLGETRVTKYHVFQNFCGQDANTAWISFEEIHLRAIQKVKGGNFGSEF